jgi:hypothetical protein
MRGELPAVLILAVTLGRDEARPSNVETGIVLSKGQPPFSNTSSARCVLMREMVDDAARIAVTANIARTFARCFSILNLAVRKGMRTGFRSLFRCLRQSDALVQMLRKNLVLNRLSLIRKK